MAKASWCNVSPMSGSENGTLTISAAAHAGGGVVKEAAVGSKVSTGGSAASKIAATVASGTVKVNYYL